MPPQVSAHPLAHSPHSQCPPHLCLGHQQAVDEDLARAVALGVPGDRDVFPAPRAVHQARRAVIPGVVWVEFAGARLAVLVGRQLQVPEVPAHQQLLVVVDHEGVVVAMEVVLGIARRARHSVAAFDGASRARSSAARAARGSGVGTGRTNVNAARGTRGAKGGRAPRSTACHRKAPRAGLRPSRARRRRAASPTRRYSHIQTCGEAS